MTKCSNTWSVPSLTWDRALHKTPCHRNSLFPSQIVPINILLRETLPTLPGHPSLLPTALTPCVPHSQIHAECHTILLSPDCTLEHFLSPHEFRNSSTTEAFIITVAPGTELIFIKHFLAPGITLINNCFIFTAMQVRCFYYTLLRYKETEMKRA